LSRPSRPQAPHRVDSAHYITARVRGVRLADIRKRVRITQNSERFLELREVLSANQHSRITAVASDHHAVMLTFDTVNELGEVVTS
jgi:hypothetical protein